MRHDVWGVSGRRYAPWLDRITYKPGWRLTLSDEMGFRAWHDRWHVDTEVADVEVTLRIDATVEDSTTAWPNASWSEAERSSRHHPASLLEEAIPMLVRSPVRVAMAHQIRPGITDFADFLGEVRNALLGFELHERDEWLKVATPTGRVLPYNPHDYVATQAAALKELS